MAAAAVAPVANQSSPDSGMPSSDAGNKRVPRLVCFDSSQTTERKHGKKITLPDFGGSDGQDEKKQVPLPIGRSVGLLSE